MHIRTIIVATIAVLGIADTGLGERGGDFSGEQKLLASDGAKGDRFGHSVAISVEMALVGAYEDTDNGENTGSAYIYQRQGDGSWSEVAKLTASDGDSNDYFGVSVAISGEMALVGAYGDSDNGSWTGSAYIYQREGDDSWSEVAKLTASDGEIGDYFGVSVAISGEIALVGAHVDDDNGENTGSAYIYQRQGDGSWNEVAKLTASDGWVDDRFGHSVAISGEMALVGAHYDDDNGDDSGSAYIYQRQVDGSWNEVAKLTASDGAEYDRFGHSVAISGEMALVGAYGDTDYGYNSGSAYLFQREGDGSWSEVAKLTASDGAEYDRFGWSVAISVETALVGAHYDNDNGGWTGSAYLFQREGDGSWSEVAKLTASDGAKGDWFGWSVAISGETALVGAYGDTDHGPYTGSAYIFGPPAPPANGACCVHTGCEILTLEQCSNMGGVFMAGESCEECDPVCLGDVNGDGQVNVADLLTVIANWNNCP